MKKYLIVTLLLVIMLVALPAVLKAAGSTATQGYPVILSTTTTGTYGCGTQRLPCTIPVDATHPLPTTSTGG